MNTLKKECFLLKDVEVLSVKKLCQSVLDNIKTSFREHCKGHGERCLLCIPCAQKI